MDRQEKMVAGLDVARLQGLEIGALSHPVVRRGQGPITYVDYATADELRANYAGHAVVEVDAIVEVDAVWGAKTLKDCLGGRTVDYAIASHVIEHVPDMITWLGEIEEALAPAGQLRLAVPDKRYTFDLFRRPTSLADLIVAHLLRARRPGLQQIVDCTLNSIYAETGWVWEGRIDRTAFEKNNGAQAAMWAGRRFLDEADYTDIHCWVFSPRDFARLFGRAAADGFIRFRCTRFFDTEPGANEFIVHLEKCADPHAAAASWRAMEEGLGPSLREPVETEDGTISIDAVRALERRLKEREAELAAIRNSRTWRATAPVRAALGALKRRRA